ncbi:MAG: hypothetical protein ACYC96_02870 [Fimbriimonadaceae bacterium]
MRVARQVSFVVGLLVVSGLCSSCSSDSGGGSSSNGQPTAQQKAASAAVQPGANGVKARNGGGMAPSPEQAKPGEHVGPPGAGGKTGG